jgi:hypothetical protein
MTDSLSLIPTPSLVADTIFNVGPNDVLAAVDAYGTSPENVINNLAGLLSGFDSSILDNVESDLESLANMAAAIAAPLAEFAIDTGLMTGRIGNLAGGKRAYLSTVSANILADLVRGRGLNAATANRVTVQIGNVVTRTNYRNPSDINNFVGLLNALIGPGDSLATVVDEGATTSLLGGAMITCIGLGLSSLIPGLLTSAVATVSAAAITAALIAVAPIACLAADLVALAAILGCNQPFGQPSGGWCIELAVPNAVPLILTHYRMPPDHAPQFYNSYLNQMLAVLTGINPNWDTINRDGTKVNNLLALINASADALTIFKTEEKYLVMATIAGDYKSTDPITSAQSMYPNLYFPPAATVGGYGTTNGSSFSLGSSLPSPF